MRDNDGQNVSSKQQYLEHHLRSAQECLQQQQPNGVLAMLAQHEDEFRDNGVAWELRGLALFALREHAKAAAAFEVATILKPLTPLAQCRLAECYLRLRKRDLASLIFTHLATLPELEQEVVEATSNGLNRLADYSTALNLCLANYKRFGRCAGIMFNITEAMRHLDFSTDKILPFAYQAHHQAPANLSFRISFAGCLLDAERQVEAKRVLAVDIDSLECVAALTRLRNVYQRLDDEDRVDLCNSRLLEMYYWVSSSYRPPK